MKFSLFAIPALVAGAFAAPAMTQEKRQVGQLVNLVESLVSDVTDLTGKLNATVVSVGAAGVSASVKLDIKETLETVVSTIEGVVDATGAIQLVDNITGDVENHVSGLVADLIMDINGTLKNVEAIVDVSSIKLQISSITNILGSLLNVLQGLGLQNILSLVTGLLNVLPVGQVTGIISGLGLL